MDRWGMDRWVGEWDGWIGGWGNGVDGWVRAPPPCALTREKELQRTTILRHGTRPDARGACRASVCSRLVA